jgi:hypothetical protein
MGMQAPLKQIMLRCRKSALSPCNPGCLPHQRCDPILLQQHKHDRLQAHNPLTAFNSQSLSLYLYGELYAGILYCSLH